MDSNLENQSQFLFYNSNEGNIKVQVIIDAKTDTVWASEKTISEIFNIDRSGVFKHIQNIYETSELQEDGTCAKIAQVQKEGTRDVTREIVFYNLDVIIAVVNFIIRRHNYLIKLLEERELYELIGEAHYERFG